MESYLISLAEAAQFMGIESQAVKRPQNRLWELLPGLLLEGFPARKVGRRWMVHRAQLGEWITRNWRR